MCAARRVLVPQFGVTLSSQWQRAANVIASFRENSHFFVCDSPKVRYVK